MPKAEAQSGVALERSPSHLLHRALQHALDIYVEQAGPSAPTQRQFAVLSAVASNEGLSQTDLVRATGIDRSTLADLVARHDRQGPAGARALDHRRPGQHRAPQRRRPRGPEGGEPKVIAADEKILSLVPARARESFLSVLLTMSEAAEQEDAAYEGPDVESGPGKKKKKAKADGAAPKAGKAFKNAKAAKPARDEPAADKKKKKKPKK
jgi:hypothetical protein